MYAISEQALPVEVVPAVGDPLGEVHGLVGDLGSVAIACAGLPVLRLDLLDDPDGLDVVGWNVGVLFA